MTTLKELNAQMAAIQKQIAELKERETSDAIAKVRALIEDYGLTSTDVFLSSKSKSKGAAKKTGTVAAKYKDPVTGSTWSGRGLPPKWLKGKDKNDFLIR